MPETLKELWNFDDADLTANRAGQISEKQKTYLAGEHKSQKNVFLGVGASVVLIFLCVPVLVVGSRVLLPAIISGDVSMPSFLPAGIGLGAICAFAVPVFAVLAIYVVRANKNADLSIKSAGGRAVYSWGTKRVRRPGSKARPYEDVRVLHLTLGEKKFEVHSDLQEVIREGEDWRIYYTSYPFKFLSGEKIS